MTRRAETYGTDLSHGDRARAGAFAVRRRGRLARRILTREQEEDALAEALGALRGAIRALPRGDEALLLVSDELEGLEQDHAQGGGGASRAADRLDTILEKVKAVTGFETDTATLVDPLRKIAALFGVALG